MTPKISPTMDESQSRQMAAVRRSIAENAVFDTPYVVMNVLATVVASYGLLANSPAVVIGAMIIALLLAPIMGVALGLVDGDNALLLKAALSLSGGVLVVMLTALVIGRVHIEMPITNEIMARTAPNLLDLMVALGGGAAGAYAVSSPRLSVAFVGVAIATALVPPLCACSLLMARGEWQLAGGAFLLAFTNIVAIQVASSFVMWASGYNRITRSMTGNQVLLRNLFSLVIIGGLTIILIANLKGAISKLIFESGTRQILAQRMVSYAGANVVDVRFSYDSDKTVVRATVRGPKAMTSADVGKFERVLPAGPGLKTLELRIRFVPTTIITKNGILYQNDDSLPFDIAP